MDLQQHYKNLKTFWISSIIFQAASTSENEHEQHLRTLVQCFSEYGVLVNPAKCVFGATEVTFLGYTVSAAGTRPAAINGFQQPVLVKDLRYFLGMLNFYWWFIPQDASILQAPLHAALAGPKVKGAQPVAWTPNMVQAFEDCKASLSCATFLAHLDPSAMLALFTDASDIAIGAALQRHACGAWQPLAFYSHKLSPAQ
jgi:hypothetical protein